MKNVIFLVFFFIISFIANGQDIIISFQSKELINSIDSIYATNLRTNKTVKLLKDESLILVKDPTFSTSLKDNSEIGYIYPNPSTNYSSFFCFSTKKSQDVEIDMYNFSGQLLSKMKQNLTEGIHHYELKFPLAGTYYLTLLKSDGFSTYKAVFVGNKLQSSSISYLTSQKLNSINSELTLLKNTTTNKEIVYSNDDVILFSFFSGKNTTILSDIPVYSKTIDVEFVSCIDFDNKCYKAVKIGTQWWMAENLAYLPSVSPPTLGSDSLTYYYVYGYTGSDVVAAKATEIFTKYGVLYNWPGAKLSCPIGWHLPSDSEWNQLEMTLGMTRAQADSRGWRGTDQGTQLKSTKGWDANGNGTNSSGFTAVPAGYRYSNGTFKHIGGHGCWWSSTEYSKNDPWFHFVVSSYTTIDRNYNFLFKEYGWSVRCVKDN